MNLARRLGHIEAQVTPPGVIDPGWYDDIRRLVETIMATMEPAHRALVRNEIAVMLRSSPCWPQMTGPPERRFVADGTIGPLTWAILDMARAHVDGTYRGELLFPKVVSSYYVESVIPDWQPWPVMLDPWDECCYLDCGFRWMPAGLRKTARTCPVCGLPLTPRMTGWDWRRLADTPVTQSRFVAEAIERLGYDETHWYIGFLAETERITPALAATLRERCPDGP